MENIARPYNDEELAALALRVHGTARDKGWWPDDVEGKIVFADGDLEDKLVLIASEAAEAFEEYRQPTVELTKTYSLVPVPLAEDPAGRTVRVDYIAGTKPEGFPIEVADIYIRALDLMVATGNMPQPIVLSDTGRTPWKKPGKHLFKLLGYVVAAPQDLAGQLTHVLAVVELCCHDLGVDLRAAVALKADYNESRPARHGGKRA
jgi:hypothetical protein